MKTGLRRARPASRALHDPSLAVHAGYTMPDQPPITCRQLFDFILDYVEGTLAADERAEFERHLGGCPSCVAYLEGYRRTIALGQEALHARTMASDEPADGRAPAGLIDAVRAARARAR